MYRGKYGDRYRSEIVAVKRVMSEHYDLVMKEVSKLKC